MLTLYHGTNTTFEKIDLSKCLPHKDFGKGFYLTTIRQQAMARAKNKCNFEGGTPIVLAYHINENEFANLKIKRFEGTSEEWANFIFTNRNKRSTMQHDYDVVIGPVADDGVIASIHLYETKVIDLEAFLKRLEFAHPTIQYAFCTERAIALLKRI